MRILRVLLRRRGWGLLLVRGRMTRGRLAVRRTRCLFLFGFSWLRFRHRHWCRCLFRIFFWGILVRGGGIAVFRNHRGLRSAGGLALSLAIAKVLVGGIATTGQGCEEQGDA